MYMPEKLTWIDVEIAKAGKRFVDVVNTPEVRGKPWGQYHKAIAIKNGYCKVPDGFERVIRAVVDRWQREREQERKTTFHPYSATHPLNCQNKELARHHIQNTAAGLVNAAISRIS